ncbi:Xaa-Pro dipeptidase/ectoine hydrolase [Bradyrhizobium sp. Rc2d]|uniref:M24 family metallopeptidase n=1 Tax=Bradyrhizobium sp. Rc2d TaxID=1855321 RepID=UPI00089238B1|nr:Xaa-Pro peptidase family protein [Bradyrhizobium sp. Rc2d]SDJ99202.1 Xaa-Pro dipeptidase/ectoine hydrolase [Bradyrhizobium sp. Rc2d]
MTVSKLPQPFPRSEYIRRLAAVKSEMARREIDALIVHDAANLTYLTGHTGKATVIPQALVVSLQKEEPTLILRKMDAPSAHYQTFLEPGSVIAYSEDLIGNPRADGYDVVIDLLNDFGLASRGVGLEQSTLPPLAVDKFKKRLPKARFVDGTGLIDWIRIVKSDLEIAIMREAAAITDKAFARAAEVIRPDVREADAAAEIIGALVRGVNGKAGSDIQNFYMCASPLTGTPHVQWTDGTLRDGSQINLELGGKRHHYVVGGMRTFCIGKPSERLRRIHEGEVEGLEAALANVRPGVTCSDVANVFYRTLEKHGFKKESRCGYSIGINWLEQTASLRDGDMTELKPNMTFHMMLGNWVDEEFGYVIGETFRVTESGAEVFTKTPRKLFEI